MTNEERLELQFNYAWKWFDYHAKQRISMFNFFLIAIGVFGAAYGTAYNHYCNADNQIAAIVGFAGAFVCIAFIFLDFRNRHLLEFAEKVLLENEAGIFPKDDGGAIVGISTEGIRRQDEVKTKECCRYLCQHKFWIPFTEIVLAVCFFSGGCYALTVSP